MPALQSKKADLTSDKEKFKKLIQQLEANRSQLEVKLEEKSREIQSKGGFSLLWSEGGREALAFTAATFRVD
jgi:hypothetical protein